MSFTLQGIDMLGIKTELDAGHLNAIRGGLLNAVGINNFKATNLGTAAPDSQVRMTADRVRLWDPSGNTPAIAKDVDVEVDLSLCDGYTADVLTGGTASASSTYYGYSPVYAFDGNDANLWLSNTLMSSSNPWIQYDLGDGATKTFQKVRVKWNISTRTPTSLKIQGSNNGSSWEDLATVTPATFIGWEEYAFSNSTAYRFLRLYSVSGAGDYMYVYEIEAMELLGGAGAGGMDAGSVAADTWYYIWLIGQCAADDGRATNLSSIASLSADSPTMPVGYTYRRLVGVCRTGAGGVLKSFAQLGSTWLYTEHQQVVYRTSTIARNTRSLAAFVPPEASIGLLTYRTYSPNSTSEAGGGIAVTGATGEITNFDSDKIEESQTTVWMPVSGQKFDYRWTVSAGANYLYIYCLGFRWPIRKEP